MAEVFAELGTAQPQLVSLFFLKKSLEKIKGLDENFGEKHEG